MLSVKLARPTVSRKFWMRGAAKVSWRRPLAEKISASAGNSCRARARCGRDSAH